MVRSEQRTTRDEASDQSTRADTSASAEHPAVGPTDLTSSSPHSLLHIFFEHHQVPTPEGSGDSGPEVILATAVEYSQHAKHALAGYGKCLVPSARQQPSGRCRVLTPFLPPSSAFACKLCHRQERHRPRRGSERTQSRSEQTTADAMKLLSLPGIVPP